jgi:hypothetical protein
MTTFARTALASLAFASFFAAVGCASTADDGASTGLASGAAEALSSDPCVAAALDAAEKEYGNDPEGTKVKTLTKGKKYRVTVGIRNPEDGPEDFYVVFPSGCSSKPQVSDVPELPHPLRNAMQKVYSGILHDHDDAIPSGFAIASSDLPSAARRQFKTWTDNGPSVCSKVGAWSIKVDGQATFAVSCDVAHDSIRTHVAVYDADGGDIDQVAIYFDHSVGQDGLSWQNETFLQQD